MKMEVTSDLFKKLFNIQEGVKKFSEEGLDALYDFLIQSETGGDNEIIIDIADLYHRCFEFKSLEDALSSRYSYMKDIEELKLSKGILGFNGGFIIYEFC
mgnify:CR=1 FL=1